MSTFKFVLKFFDLTALGYWLICTLKLYKDVNFDIEKVLDDKLHLAYTLLAIIYLMIMCFRKWIKTNHERKMYILDQEEKKIKNKSMKEQLEMETWNNNNKKNEKIN